MYCKVFNERKAGDSDIFTFQRKFSIHTTSFLIFIGSSCRVAILLTYWWHYTFFWHNWIVIMLISLCLKKCFRWHINQITLFQFSISWAHFIYGTGSTVKILSSDEQRKRIYHVTNRDLIKLTKFLKWKLISCYILNLTVQQNLSSSVFVTWNPTIKKRTIK